MNPSAGRADTAPDPAGWLIEAPDFGHIFEILRSEDYAVVGPTIRDGAIVYDELSGPSDLPAGWTDRQEPGRYTLQRRDDDAYFGYVVGPQSWKKFLFPSRLRLWSAAKSDSGFTVEPDIPAPRKLAFVGVRACELAAIRVQDNVFLGGTFKDSRYEALRANVFVLAVNCVQAGGTCFCASMKTGPKAREGYDIVVTEVIDGDRHYFVAFSGSDHGAHVLRQLQHRRATAEEKAAAWSRESDAVKQMGRALDTHGLKDMLLAARTHPQWESIAQRCLGCANCTMVCPTCFCSTVEDVVDITGDHAERWRRWDSCFNQEFSYIHGGSVRVSTAARYRQWMTHKLATWYEQFGGSGCVGCGRCITWCPVGIDITREAGALRDAVTKRGK